MTLSSGTALPNSTDGFPSPCRPRPGVAKVCPEGLYTLLISVNPVRTLFQSTLLNASVSFFELSTCFLPGPWSRRRRRKSMKRKKSLAGLESTTLSKMEILLELLWNPNHIPTGFQGPLAKSTVTWEAFWKTVGHLRLSQS